MGTIIICFIVVGLIISVMTGRGQDKRRAEAKRPYDGPKNIADGKWASDALISKRGLFGSKGIKFGYSESGYQLADNSDMHTVLIGPAGAGKNVLVQTQTAHSNPRQSMAFMDGKGEQTFLSIAHRSKCGPVVVFAPYTPTKDLPKGVIKAVLNPIDRFHDGSLTKEEEYSECEALAALLHPEDGSPAGGFFTKGVRAVTARGIHATVRYGRPDEQNLPAIARIFDDYEGFCRRMEACADAETAARFRDDRLKLESGNRAFQDVVYTGQVDLAFFNDPAVAAMLTGKSTFRIADMRRMVMTVYAIFPIDKIQSSGPLLRLFTGLFISALTRTDAPKKHKVLMLVDETQTLGRLDQIMTAYSAGRGYGIRIMTTWHDIAEMEAVYGAEAHSMIANSGVRIFIAPQDQKTASYLESQLGSSEVFTRSKSVHVPQKGEPHVSDQLGSTPRPLMHAWEILQMPSDVGLVWIRGLKGPIRAKLVPYFKDFRYRFRVGKNPYHA